MKDGGTQFKLDKTARISQKYLPLIWSNTPNDESRPQEPMSTPSATDFGPVLDPSEYTLGEKLYETVRDGIEAAFFWGAIVLPFLHVPLLLTGLSSTAELISFGVLVALNAVAIVVGHSYHRE